MLAVGIESGIATELVVARIGEIELKENWSNPAMRSSSYFSTVM
jgi:hypothetical protein